MISYARVYLFLSHITPAPPPFPSSALPAPASLCALPHYTSRFVYITAPFVIFPFVTFHLRSSPVPHPSLPPSLPRFSCRSAQLLHTIPLHCTLAFHHPSSIRLSLSFRSTPLIHTPAFLRYFLRTILHSTFILVRPPPPPAPRFLFVHTVPYTHPLPLPSLPRLSCRAILPLSFTLLCDLLLFPSCQRASLPSLAPSPTYSYPPCPLAAHKASLFLPLPAFHFPSPVPRLPLTFRRRYYHYLY
ncbi:hypothetical protein DFH06DRAFT_1180144 [Mycena polygramma]|nr:hypothetical protein DFH06DRAFT_1180144 [Mycena polygramma]